MPIQLSMTPARAAVLSLDCQAGIVSIYAKDRPDLLNRAASVLRAARRVGMTVIHVQVGFRPNLPEISSRNPLFSALKASARHRQLFEGASGAIHAALAPEAEEIVVTKHRVNAFSGTDLDMILRAKDIDTIVLFGIATSGVVLATLLHGTDADYRVAVIADCCADLDPDVHACLLEKVFPRHATVLTARDFLEVLGLENAAQP